MKLWARRWAGRSRTLVWRRNWTAQLSACLGTQRRRKREMLVGWTLVRDTESSREIHKIVRRKQECRERSSKGCGRGGEVFGEPGSTLTARLLFGHVRIALPFEMGGRTRYFKTWIVTIKLQDTVRVCYSSCQRVYMKSSALLPKSSRASS